MPKRPDMTQARGFTLIEVLVVVAIIVLLVSILLPSLSTARKRARGSVCLSNMRQLGVASHMYANVWKGVLVDYGLAHDDHVHESEDESEAESTTWVNSLRREYGNKLVTRCPEDDSPYWTQPYPDTEEKRRVSYGVNEYLTGRIDGYERYRRLEAIRRPATTILFCEMTRNGEYAISDHVHPVDWVVNPRVEAAKQIELALHVEKSNYVFADSHAEPHRFEQTFHVKGQRREGAKLIIDWVHNMYDPTLAY
ncbi:MAG TPA: prepilin-type N-terminal cleavage/methylation domain-containing protein [Phycisphaerae bacterium]|nr:prepilin-type N-terminal cleavage/methylation domain-containing protein [Phycisphaerae bacterium]HOJ73871.1 prepilin-type N-terminal cleavage/methylation domain-containing protein [Phycisphaerae bacterium]HOM50812.1 prepilin-type N-terminal cleavage/methylation domain-containing protein [Phycisphaerae bacterium]HON65562.1 prepilin-type N-terminal cleavage/methylation domain-containing protein [Phycisphaerae bacterium]HOQ88046.1 prepilin-type N-terminal cleavage/methylation domain-containing 